MGGAVGIPGR